MSAEVVKGLTNEIRTLKINGHVGFDTLPYQLVNKAVNQGFSFNILCLGETGLGKSTLMETLFEQNFNFTPSTHDLPEVTLKVSNYDLKEGNVKLKLSIIESCGFGDQINKEDCINPIIKYIDGEFEKYLQEEMKIKRSLHTYCDTRVHVCLYFITPSGHTLKSLDLVAMKKLDSKVNIIPVIAKSDTITKAEMQKFKAKIMSEIQANKINIYQFPTGDETVRELNSQMNQLLPFAVVGSNEEAKMPNGKTARVRQYPWGTVQVDNETHCDFVRLREMMLRTNMDDLRERTHAAHYETYRRQRLIEMGFNDSENMSLQETYEQRRETQTKELKQKEEEIRQMFFMRVKEKENHLKEADKELQAKFEALKKSHAEEKRKLEERRRILEEDMGNFERRKAAVEQAKVGNTIKKKK